jgi:hypothetical protein
MKTCQTARWDFSRAVFTTLMIPRCRVATRRKTRAKKSRPVDPT